MARRAKPKYPHCPLYLLGLCETCDKPIARERLSAIPYARLCFLQERGES